VPRPMSKLRMVSRPSTSFSVSELLLTRKEVQRILTERQFVNWSQGVNLFGKSDVRFGPIATVCAAEKQ